MNNFQIIGQQEAATVYGGLSDKTLRELMNLLGKLLGAAFKYLYDLLTNKEEPQSC
ncbi:MAG: hypothetical protein IKY60_01175 [Bacteroidales bacterium]|nr:hypothetical protein [Bacteroidales bacterium]